MASTRYPSEHIQKIYQREYVDMFKHKEIHLSKGLNKTENQGRIKRIIKLLKVHMYFPMNDNNSTNHNSTLT